MSVNVNLDELIKEVYDDKNLIKMRKNGIYLSDNQIIVLKNHGIDHNKYSSIKSLIFDIENILNEEPQLDDLEEVSRSLSEINYYMNTKK